MKKSVIAFFACVAVAGSALAGSTYVASGKETKEYKTYEEPFTCFSDQELQLDVFGIYTNTEGGGYGDGFGGGLGVNYFFARYIGIGADADIFDEGNDGVWGFTGRVIARYPIDSICLAPYAFGGGGYQMDGSGTGTLHAGGGLEYRVIPHKLGLFAEGRYTWALSAQDESVEIRAGVRIVF